MPETKTRIELLQNMPIFGGINANALNFLVGLANVVSVKKNDYFFHEGDSADSLFVLESGQVALNRIWKNKPYPLKVLRNGDCFGEVALIDLQPRSASALALADSICLELTANDLYQLYKKNTEQFALIYMNMAREVCRRLREADDRAFNKDQSLNLQVI